VTGAPDANLNLGTPPGIKSFFVRNNSVEPDELLIDELRIGTTWEDVTPAVPEPASAILALLSLGLAAMLRRRS
jgi:MYXO-CTERM domain-containing protein